MDFAIDLDMGLICIVLLPIVGAALIGGGIVAYLGSTAVMARAFSAASVVAGLAMWLVIASVTITSSSGTAPEPVIVASAISSDALPVSKQTFLHLLTARAVERLLAADVPLTTSYRDYKEMAENTDPAQVGKVDSWFGLTIETAGSSDAVEFTLIDFDSPTSASAHFEKMRSAKKAPPESEASFGGSAYRVEMNFQSIGSILVVVKVQHRDISRPWGPWKASMSLPRWW